jgi:predicted RNase H-like HicB family nuclease
VKLTAVFEPATEGGYTCFVEEIPAAISQGETLEEAKTNLREVLQLVLEWPVRARREKSLAICGSGSLRLGLGMKLADLERHL